MTRKPSKKNKARCEQKRVEGLNVLKTQGASSTRAGLRSMERRFYDENRDVLAEAKAEQSMLRMKKYFLRRNWIFPPRTHQLQYIVDAINKRYGEETCTLSKEKQT